MTPKMGSQCGPELRPTLWRSNGQLYWGGLVGHGFQEAWRFRQGGFLEVSRPQNWGHYVTPVLGSALCILIRATPKLGSRNDPKIGVRESTPKLYFLGRSARQWHGCRERVWPIRNSAFALPRGFLKVWGNGLTPELGSPGKQHITFGC